MTPETILTAATFALLALGFARHYWLTWPARSPFDDAAHERRAGA